jgi:Mg/Co/Ni transporter MgtE
MRMMRENKITPEIILAMKPNLDKKNVIEAMNEHTGIKIIEAVNMLVKDLPEEQKNKLLSNIDKVIDRVL